METLKSVLAGFHGWQFVKARRDAIRYGSQMRWVYPGFDRAKVSLRASPFLWGPTAEFCAPLRSLIHRAHAQAMTWHAELLRQNAPKADRREARQQARFLSDLQRKSRVSDADYVRLRECVLAQLHAGPLMDFDYRLRGPVSDSEVDCFPAADFWLSKKDAHLIVGFSRRMGREAPRRS